MSSDSTFVPPPSAFGPSSVRAAAAAPSSPAGGEAAAARAKVLSVIIPVFNELHTLELIVDKVRSVPLPEGMTMEIIVVDDYSTDGTRNLYPKVRPLVSRVLLHRRNQGKGAAIRTGLQYVTGDFVVIQDADLEYDPNEFLTLLKPLLEDRADVVYGSRFLGGHAHRVLYFWHTVGNTFLTLLSNMFTDLNLTDMETCYKMFRRSALEGIVIEQDRFGFEPEITGKLAQRDLRFYEIGISYHGRTYAEGKKIGVKDGFQAIYCILKYSRGRYRDVGRQTLQRLETDEEYGQWIYDRVGGSLGASVVEIGSGMGALGRFLADRAKVYLTDLRSDYFAALVERFQGHSNVHVRQVDVLDPPAELLEQGFESAVSCNCIEHIEDDVTAIRNMGRMVRPGGKVVVLVPAFQALMSPLDYNLGHYRRYTTRSLSERFRLAGLEVEEASYLNFVGCVGWFVAGRVFRQGTIRPAHVTLHKFVQPIARAIEKHIFRERPPFGLSVIVTGRRPE